MEKEAGLHETKGTARIFLRRIENVMWLRVLPGTIYSIY
jgi:cell division protein YceG involved in septum cleavage